MNVIPNIFSSRSAPLIGLAVLGFPYLSGFGLLGTTCIISQTADIASKSSNNATEFCGEIVVFIIVCLLVLLSSVFDSVTRFKVYNEYFRTTKLFDTLGYVFMVLLFSCTTIYVGAFANGSGLGTLTRLTFLCVGSSLIIVSVYTIVFHSWVSLSSAMTQGG